MHTYLDKVAKSSFEAFFFQANSQGCLKRGVLVLVRITSRDMGVRKLYSDGHVDISGWM